MTQQSTQSTGTLFSLKLSLILVGLLFSIGCYTQLQTTYSEREPDHQTITEYETDYGDSVVVDNYYYEDNYYNYHPRSNRYRRHFSTFYGHPYGASTFYDPFYDPFYDDYWYGGSSLHLNFGWGYPSLYSPVNYGWYNPYRVYANPYYGRWGSPWGHRGYYGNPVIYHHGYIANYGPRPSRIGRRGVRSRSGSRYATNENDQLSGRRSVTRQPSQRGSQLAQSRTRSGSIARSARTRGIQRQADDDATTRSRRGVIQRSSRDGSRSTSTRVRGTRTGNSRSAVGSGSTSRTRSSSATRTRTRSAPRTRSTPTTRSSSSTRTRSAPRTRSTPSTRSSSSTRTRSAPRTRSTPSTRSSSSTRTRSAPQTRSTPKTRSSSSGSSSRSTPSSRSNSRKRGSSLSDLHPLQLDRSPIIDAGDATFS
ncbi:MAG: hypothetical protein OXE59_03385 [Bacteroidetes bacterium]|nr:hypothetical protein [Bacteroidota bacterium]